MLQVVPCRLLAIGREEVESKIMCNCSIYLIIIYSFSVVVVEEDAEEEWECAI